MFEDCREHDILSLLKYAFMSHDWINLKKSLKHITIYFINIFLFIVNVLGHFGNILRNYQSIVCFLYLIRVKNKQNAFTQNFFFIFFGIVWVNSPITNIINRVWIWRQKPFLFNNYNNNNRKVIFIYISFNM